MKKTNAIIYYNAPVCTYRRPYPNAADPHYFARKIVDGILSVVTALGALTILFFLIAM